MGKISKSINKIAISKDQFKKLITDEQFAIIAARKQIDFIRRNFDYDQMHSIQENSIFIKDISFNAASNIAKANNQQSFIYKPKNGPVQLISINKSEPIIISKKYAYSTGDNLYSIFEKDQSSIWFDFTNQAIKLPNKEKPYTWKEINLT